MPTPLLLAEVPNWVPIFVGFIGVFGSLLGVCGALMAQRYIVAANKVREKYKTLREAYASFVATEHTFVSLCKNHYENDLGLIKNAKAIACPLDDEMKARIPEALHAEAAENIKANAKEDIAHRRDLNLAMNTRFGNAAEEVHRTFVLVFMLDPSSRRKEELRERYHEARNVPAAYKAAKKDKSVPVENIPKLVLDGIEDWVAVVAQQIDLEEDEALANISPFRS